MVFWERKPESFQIFFAVNGNKGYQYLQSYWKTKLQSPLGCQNFSSKRCLIRAKLWCDLPSFSFLLSANPCSSTKLGSLSFAFSPLTSLMLLLLLLKFPEPSVIAIIITQNEHSVLGTLPVVCGR